MLKAIKKLLKIIKSQTDQKNSSIKSIEDVYTKSRLGPLFARISNLLMFPYGNTLGMPIVRYTRNSEE